MRLSMKAMSFVSALLWKASALVVCLLPIVPTYETGFLDGISSIIPAFTERKALAPSYWVRDALSLMVQ